MEQKVRSGLHVTLQQIGYLQYKRFSTINKQQHILTIRAGILSYVYCFYMTLGNYEPRKTYLCVFPRRAIYFFLLVLVPSITDGRKKFATTANRYRLGLQADNLISAFLCNRNVKRRAFRFCRLQLRHVRGRRSINFCYVFASKQVLDGKEFHVSRRHFH